MMGLGFLGSSTSSSASSNLSPLAPPFAVDRYNHNKPNLNSNPVSPFDDPSYGVPFSSSWLYSHPSTARQDFLADSIRTATVPCANDNGYTSPEPISSTSTHNWFGVNSSVKPGLEQLNPTGTHWSAVNTSPRHATDLFSNNVSAAKPFYPSYAWPVSNSDIPSVALNNPRFVLPSTSDLVIGDGPSQVDYSRSLSGLEHNPQWEDIWSELPGGKHGKRMESDVSFLSEEANIAGSLASRRYINQGAYGTDTLSKRKEDSAMFPGNGADVFGRENYIGPPISGMSDSISSTAKDHGLVPNEFSEAPAFKALPMFSESHPLVPSLEPPEEHRNCQKSYRLHEKRFHMFDCSDHCISPSITKPSHSLVIKPPGPVTNFSAQRTGPTKSVEINDSAAFDSSKVVGSTHNPLKDKELHLSLGFDDKGSFLFSNQPSFQIGRTDETFVVPSSTREEMSNKLSTNDQLYFEFKARSNFQVPDINSLNFNSTENVMSAATSSEHSDHHNPAEDSPCWKGSPTSHFSPFKSPEAESPQHPTKKLQTCNGVNLLGSQTDHSFYHSSKAAASELHENSNSSERTSANTPIEKEHKSGGAVDVGFGSTKASSREAQSSHDIIKPRKGYDFLRESTNDLHSETSQLKLPNLEEDALLSNGTTGISHGRAGRQCAHYQQRNYDIFGRSIKKLQGFASPREYVDLPKDQNMIQAIKKILDENLECKEELPSQTLLYKNLWLEAEAELCVFNYRARFERMKKEMENCKSDKATDVSEITSAKKKTSSSNCSPDPKFSPMLIHEADGSMISNTRVQNPPFSSVDRHMDDVEASVMARFNILKCRGESNNVERQQIADVEVSSMGSQTSRATVGPHLQHHLGIDDAMHSLADQMMWNQFGSGANNVESSIMARLNVLKCRGEPNAVGVEEQELADATDAEVIGKESCTSVTVRTQYLHQADKEDAVATQSDGTSLMQQFDSDWEHIFKDEISWQTNGHIS